MDIHMQRMKLKRCLTPSTKNQLKIKALNIKSENLKLLEEN